MRRAACCAPMQRPLSSGGIYARHICIEHRMTVLGELRVLAATAAIATCTTQFAVSQNAATCQSRPEIALLSLLRNRSESEAHSAPIVAPNARLLEVPQGGVTQQATARVIGRGCPTHPRMLLHDAALQACYIHVRSPFAARACCNNMRGSPRCGHVQGACMLQTWCSTWHQIEHFACILSFAGP